jgi:hypothetical protein
MCPGLKPLSPRFLIEQIVGGLKTLAVPAQLSSSARNSKYAVATSDTRLDRRSFALLRSRQERPLPFINPSNAAPEVDFQLTGILYP